MNYYQVKELLDKSVLEFNRPDFIPDDPISIPHRFTSKEDIEIAGFLVAILAWGNRKTIIRNTNSLLTWMDNAPAQFIRNFKEGDLKPFTQFVHRTFNGDDCLFFLNSLQNIYTRHEGLEQAFSSDADESEAKYAIMNFRQIFLQTPHLQRSEKHLANPQKNSSAKRINMFLRWMVRKDSRGVDFGLWNSLSPAALMCPLDVHTANVSRQLGLLSRKQNDWKAVEELTGSLREFDPDDPVKYDLALFGLGVNHRVEAFGKK